MGRIAIVKVQSRHDVQWKMNGLLDAGLGAVSTAFDLSGLRAMRQRLRDNHGRPFMPQLTLPYLAALGRAHCGDRHTFELIDEREHDVDLSGYDMAWFTAVTPTANAAYRLASKARSAGITTVMGGIHASTLPDEAGRFVDAVVVGEAEPVIPELLDDYDHGRLQPLYRGGRSCSLDALHVPRWSDARVSDYCPWVVPVQTSRGCRNACHFCSTTRFQGAARRHRPVEEIVAEIRDLQRQGVITPSKTVFFTDNNIVSDSDHRRGRVDTAYARALFEALAPLDVLWVGQGELDVASHPGMVELMARSGCIALLVGLESISQGSIEGTGKLCNDVGTYTHHIDALHRHGIAIIGCFIFGLDGDRPDVFERTLPFIQRHIDIPQLSMLTPFPGTPLYRRMAREDRLLHRDWSRYDVTHVVHRPARMSPEQLERGFSWLSRRIYSPRAIVTRASRHALRRFDYRHPLMTRSSELSLVLAPNVVYRALAGIGRDEPPGAGLPAGEGGRFEGAHAGAS